MSDFSNGKVGTLGYCLGGKLSYLMATRTNADCNVSYYGVGIESLISEGKKISKPYLSHIAEKDSFVSSEAQEKILSNLSDNKYCDFYVYPNQEHAFARIGGEHYNHEHAELANNRTLDFLKLNLFN